MNEIVPIKAERIDHASLESAENDVWVASSCSLWYGSCSNLAHRVDGVIAKIEGNPASEVGADEGLRSGDMIWVESEKGRKITGTVRLTQALDPEGLGIGACAGHWSDNMPKAKSKGVFFNDLLELDWEHSSPSNLSLDLCVKVKISKAEEVL